MDASDTEAIKGMLLDHWIEDLRQDKAPTPLPEMDQLGTDERAEILELARWYKGALYAQDPSSPREGADEFALRLRNDVLHVRAEERRAAAQLASAARTFGAIVRDARTRRNVDLLALERTLALPTGTLARCCDRPAARGRKAPTVRRRRDSAVSMRAWIPQRARSC
jgi:hypothetical protein